MQLQTLVCRTEAKTRIGNFSYYFIMQNSLEHGRMMWKLFISLVLFELCPKRLHNLQYLHNDDICSFISTYNSEMYFRFNALLDSKQETFIAYI